MIVEIITESGTAITEATVSGWAESGPVAYSLAQTALSNYADRAGMHVACDYVEVVSQQTLSTGAEFTLRYF